MSRPTDSNGSRSLPAVTSFVFAGVLTAVTAGSAAGAEQRITFDDLRAGSLRAPEILTNAYGPRGIRFGQAGLVRFSADSGFAPGFCSSGDQAIVPTSRPSPVAVLAMMPRPMLTVQFERLVRSVSLRAGAIGVSSDGALVTLTALGTNRDTVAERTIRLPPGKAVPVNMLIEVRLPAPVIRAIRLSSSSRVSQLVFDDLVFDDDTVSLAWDLSLSRPRIEIDDSRHATISTTVGSLGPASSPAGVRVRAVGAGWAHEALPLVALPSGARSLVTIPIPSPFEPGDHTFHVELTYLRDPDRLESDTGNNVASGQFTIAAAESVEVPSLIGLASDPASEALVAQGLQLGRVNEPNQPSTGLVVRQRPVAGTRLPIHGRVDVWLGTRAARTFRMPDLVGSQPDSARAVLDRLGLVLTSVDSARSGVTSPGRIESQRPPAGELMRRGDQVSYTLEAQPITSPWGRILPIVIALVVGGALGGTGVAAFKGPRFQIGYRPGTGRASIRLLEPDLPGLALGIRHVPLSLRTLIVTRSEPTWGEDQP